MTSDLLRRWELLCSSDVELSPDLELELWQDRIGLLTVSTAANPTPKRRIRLPVATDSGAAELATIFVIAKPAEESAISAERLSIAQSCIALITNSFALNPTDLELARAKLEDASACAREIPAFAISYPRDYARLPDVRAAMLERLEQVQAGAGGI